MKNDTPAPERGARPWYRLLLRALVVGVAVAVVIAAVVVIAYLRRSTPSEVSVDEALRRYRSSEQLQNTALLGPGVFEAQGAGWNDLDRPPIRQEDGASMPVTVESISEDCSSWRIDFNSSHSQALDFCTNDSGVEIVAQRTSKAWDLGVVTVSNVGEFSCQPPIPVLSSGGGSVDTSDRTCRGTNSSVDGPATVELRVEDLGEATVDIDGESVRARHQRWTQTLSGSQSGTLRDEWWFDAASGLPLRAERDYTLSTPTPLGVANYAESGRWALTSLESAG